MNSFRKVFSIPMSVDVIPKASRMFTTTRKRRFAPSTPDRQPGFHRHRIGQDQCFLYPIVSKCLDLRDMGARAGVSVVIVYPMNALAEDQLGRIRSLLAGTGIPFGMYVGKTPERESDVTGKRMPVGNSRPTMNRSWPRLDRRKETGKPCTRRKRSARGRSCAPRGNSRAFCLPM